MGNCLEVSRGDLGLTRMAASRGGPPGEGEVLFAVERFGLSANNVTYAALGDALRYWDLFPAEAGWGRIPVWGYLRVCSSRVPGIETGRQAFGLCPMATEVTLRPVRAGQATFTDGSAYRSGLASAYNVYSWADAGAPDAALVLRPVFWLSFTLDDHLARQAPGERPVIVTSASSKAALGLGFLLARRGVPVTGLTSARHYPFVAGLGLYDQVVRYDQAEDLAAADAVLADIAGNGGAARPDRPSRGPGPDRVRGAHPPGGQRGRGCAGRRELLRTGRDQRAGAGLGMADARATIRGRARRLRPVRGRLAACRPAPGPRRGRRRVPGDAGQRVGSPAEAHVIDVTGDGGK